MGQYSLNPTIDGGSHAITESVQPEEKTSTLNRDAIVSTENIQTALSVPAEVHMPPIDEHDDWNEEVVDELVDGKGQSELFSIAWF